VKTRRPAGRCGVWRGPPIVQQFAAALEGREGVAGAHCIHELWMRNEPPMNVERMLEQLWKVAPESVPEWLPMRYVEWLPLAYRVAARFLGPLLNLALRARLRRFRKRVRGCQLSGRVGGVPTSTWCCSITRTVRVGLTACTSE
jgi:hypothetical protein